VQALSQSAFTFMSFITRLKAAWRGFRSPPAFWFNPDAHYGKDAGMAFIHNVIIDFKEGTIVFPDGVRLLVSSGEFKGRHLICPARELERCKEIRNLQERRDASNLAKKGHTP